MPDLMDAVQQRVLDDTERAITSRPMPPVGLDDCVECDEPISALRRNLGARRCLQCETDHEQRMRARGGR